MDKDHGKKYLNGGRTVPKCNHCEYTSSWASDLRKHSKTHSGKNSNKCNQWFEDIFENAQWRKVKQMQPMWLCLFLGRQFQDSFENTQWGKVKQMQPMWLCILSSKRFEDTFENTQWRKVKHMQPMWLCLFSGKPFEETSENTQWRKVEQLQPVWIQVL